MPTLIMHYVISCFFLPKGFPRISFCIALFDQTVHISLSASVTLQLEWRWVLLLCFLVSVHCMDHMILPWHSVVVVVCVLFFFLQYYETACSFPIAFTLLRLHRDRAQRLTLWKRHPPEEKTIRATYVTIGWYDNSIPVAGYKRKKTHLLNRITLYMNAQADITSAVVIVQLCRTLIQLYVG